MTRVTPKRKNATGVGSVLLLFGFISASITEAKVPHFMLIGQSNMEGIVSGSRFEDTLDILFGSDNDTAVSEEMIPWLIGGDSRPPTPDEAYVLEANELLFLKSEGFLHNNFREPLPTVDCTFYRLNEGIDYRANPDEEPRMMAVDEDVSPYSGCGVQIGPELMLGHVMDDCYPNQLIALDKFASGGTEIYKHWSKERGWLWNLLVEHIQRINPVQDEWQAIVWFQGENDALNAQLRRGYLGNLTNFIRDVRDEMHAVDPTAFDQPSDIPVVIVGLGCWITKTINGGFLLVEAQAEFVASDPNAVMITTDDLSCHFHFDDASQLIIGYRIAQALKTLVPLPSAVPTGTPSLPVPSTTPSSAPSETPSQTPSAMPSNRPSVSPSSSPSIIPSQTPSFTPSQTPSNQPSRVAPSAAPSEGPSRTAPSTTPSAGPSRSAPSAAPSEAPSRAAPSTAPSESPSRTAPSTTPSEGPSRTAPSKTPSEGPSRTAPSITPSAGPSRTAPSAGPSEAPSRTAPSAAPSGSPSRTAPSTTPSEGPSRTAPSTTPSEGPSRTAPSATPSEAPSRTAPSADPSESPSRIAPSTVPSEVPSRTAPSAVPSEVPSRTAPSTVPSEGPSHTAPSTTPSEGPSRKVSSLVPSEGPSQTTPRAAPSEGPSHISPSGAPSESPSRTSSSGAPSGSPSQQTPSVLPRAGPSAASGSVSNKPSMEIAPPIEDSNSSPSYTPSTFALQVSPAGITAMPSVPSSTTPSAKPSNALLPNSSTTVSSAPSPATAVQESAAPTGTPGFCERRDDQCTVCTPFRSPDYCSVDESFPLLIRERTRAFRTDPATVASDGYWFPALEDKVAAYLLSTQENAPAPQIFCCVTSVEDLLECLSATVPADIPGVVIKATHFHSNQGVYALINVPDPAEPPEYQRVDLLTGIRTSFFDVASALSGMNATKTIVEEFIGSTLPTEYKLHVVNGAVASIDIIDGRDTDCPCYATVDTNWDRLDQYGCFQPSIGKALFNSINGCPRIDFDTGRLNAGPVKRDLNLCDKLPVLSKCLLDEMVSIALSLGNRIGVYMRVDMFVARNKVYVQEFTPNHMNGVRHCSAKIDASTGCVDSCFMGRMWKEAGGKKYGGSSTAVPEKLAGYMDLSPQQQCDLLVDVPPSSYNTACS